MSKELYDICLGLLFIILDLGQRIEKLEKAVGAGEENKVSEDKIKVDSEEIKKKMENYKEGLDKERNAEMEHLKAEIRRLEAEAGIYEHINKFIPTPTYGTIFPCCGGDPYIWRK